MNVSIGRQELVALCISIQHTGPEKNPGFSWMFEQRPFINGDHWRLTTQALTTATDEQLVDLYKPHSVTFKPL